MRSILLPFPRPCPPALAALLLGGILALLAACPALAAGVVTDCSAYGPGPGTLAAALATDGLVTFACSGVIVLPEEVALGNNRHLVLDGSGQAVTLSGGGRTRLFNLYRGASLQLHNLTLADGNAGAAGGGAIMSGGLLTITNSSLLSNTAGFGGALELFNGSAFIHNSTLAGNRSLGSDADSGGGAINQYFVDQGDGEGGGSDAMTTPYVEIVHSTLVGNSAVMAGRGGIWQENGRLVIRQSIIAHNENGDCRIERPNPQQFGTTASLDGDGTCLAALTADPLLAPLAAEGSAPPLFALLPGSPAVDAAPADACAGTADAAGSLRPRDGDRDGAALCDLGAYELGTRWTVLAAADEGLAGYWKFDEGAGGVSVDSSGHGLTATLGSGSGFTSAAPPLRFGSPFALQCGGTASPSSSSSSSSSSSFSVQAACGGAQVADAPALNPADLTLAAWVRFVGESAGGQPVAAKLQEGTGGRGYGLLLRGGILSGEVWDSAGVQHVITASVPTAPAPGGWLHVALTYQAGGALRLYVNGRPAAEEQPAGAAVSTSAVPLTLGALGAAGADGGAVDDVRLYSRALSAGAVAALASGRSCVTAGTTWGDAVPDLQCALLEARAGSEVWIGPGIYRPTRGPDRTATFAIADGVGVYGGFAGTENSRAERAAGTPRPVLSGDIGADDGVDAAGVLLDPAARVGANALHVVSIRSTLTPPLTSTVLEAVTVTGGQADGGANGGANGGADGSDSGGGVYIRGGAPQLHNLQLIGSAAAGEGGAIYAADSDLLLISSALAANRAGSGGGAWIAGGAPAVVNSLVAGNGASAGGGGIYSRGALRLVNVTAAGNRAAAGGGLLLESGPGGAASGSNLLVAANTAAGAAGTAQVGGGGAVLHSSLVAGGCPPTFACPGVLSGDPQFAAPGAALAPSSGGDYRLLPTSPAIDSGDNGADFSAAPAGATIASIDADVAGAPRLVAARRSPAQVDLGAYEAANAPPLFTSTPVTIAPTTLEYLYRATAVDPNAPGDLLPIEAVLTPPWLRLEAQLDGAAVLRGTPGEELYGYFDVILRSTDPLGAAAEQRFTVSVVPRVYPLYLPLVLR